MHVVWSRIDIETMTAVRLSQNYRLHELTERQLEKEFGHAKVQGVHVNRKGNRPVKALFNGHIERLKRLGIDILKIRQIPINQYPQLKEIYTLKRILKNMI